MHKQQWTRNGRSSRKSQHDNWRKSRARRRLFSKHKEIRKKSPLCHIDGHIALQKAELEPTLQKYQGRGVLRGDIVKDDSGACAVFTEQGSSASQMTASKVMDVIAKLLDCNGRAADAVSAYTQVKLEDAPRLLKIAKSECPDIWIRLPRHKWPKSKAFSIEIFPDTHWQDCCGKTIWRKFCWSLAGKKYQIGNVFCSLKTRNYLLSIHVDDMKMAGKQNMVPMWKKLMNNVDFDEPTSFLDHACLGCTQRECKPNEIIIEKQTRTFE